MSSVLTPMCTRDTRGGTQGRLAPPSGHKIRAATTTKTTFHQQGQGDKHGGQFEQTALEILPLVIGGGMTLFSFDFGGCGKSEGEHISLGWWEREDLGAVELGALEDLDELGFAVFADEGRRRP